MSPQVLIGGMCALLILILPDLVVFFRSRSLNLPARECKRIPPTKNVGGIDVIVPVKVPDDEIFALPWPHFFDQSFPLSGSKLLISSNGNWSKTTNLASRRLEILHTPCSGSKIINLEKAISASTGNIVAIFDVDAKPAGTINFEMILHHLAEVDCVQGANITVSQCSSSLDRFCEYESLVSACISETFASGEERTSQFRGTNAYFRAETIKSLRFRVDTALEDIDATIRLLCRGGRIRFEPRLLAIEAAPADRWELFKQRSRWSLGWGDLCRRHLVSVFASEQLTLFQKIRIAGYLAWVTFLSYPPKFGH